MTSDDDDAVRQALSLLVRSLQLPVQDFASAEEFLEVEPRSAVGCIVLDVSLPGMDGLALCERLAERKNHLPVILITGRARERAVDAEAFAFLDKPIDDSIVSVIRQALAKSAKSGTA